MSLLTKIKGPRSSPFSVGLSLYVGAAILLILIAIKPTLSGILAGGEEVTAEFPTSNKLTKYKSAVKVAGLESGTVTRLEYTERHTVIVHMKVDGDALESLGSDPTARIEPRNVLGGRYTVDLVPGGDPGGSFDRTIALDRSAVTTEVDQVFEEALPASAREGLRGVADKGGPALAESKRALGRLLDIAPPVFEPGAEVFEAAQGKRPRKDLPVAVDNLDRVAGTLNARDGQIESVAEDLAATATVLAEHADDLGVVLRDLPATAKSARTGLRALDGTVARLQRAGHDLRPTAPEVVALLKELAPTLREARPLLRDLQPLLDDTTPAVRNLVPVARDATEVLGDLHGPVLDRVNGPVSEFVLNPWSGTGPFADGAGGYMADHKFYEEVGYLVSNLNRASMSQDSHGSMLAFQAGVSEQTLLEGLPGSVPFSLEGIVRLALREEGVTDPAAVRKALREAGVR